MSTRPWTLPAALDAAAATRAGVFHVQEDGGEAFESYETLRGRAASVARHLAEAGIGSGCRVALLIPESEGFLPSLFGVSMTGAAVVPMAPPSHRAQLEHALAAWRRVVRVADVRAIVTSPRLRPLLGGLQAASPGLRAIWAWDDLVAAPGPFDPDVHEDAIGLIQFTSGSTSQPKGVVLPHRSLGANVTAITGPAGLGVHEGDVGLSWLPLFHDMGLIGVVLGCVHARIPVVLMPPQLFLKRPGEWLRRITRHRATLSFAPNFGYELCVRRAAQRPADGPPSGLDLSSWRVAGCGAEPIRPATLEQFAAQFAAAGFRATSFMPCYGMAEHSLAATFHPVGQPWRVDTVRADLLGDTNQAVPCEPGAAGAARFVGCGRVFPGHDIRIVSEAGTPLPERHVGEIELAGPSIMREYFHEDRLSREAIRDGWFRTGDLGYLAEGDLFVCGRKRELIIVNGRNYHPQDLEWTASEVGAVRRGSVVAFGTDGPEGTEQLVLVLESRGQTEAAALTAEVRRRVQEATGLHVHDVVVVPRGSIPKTTSGKLQRARVKARYEAGELLQASSPRSRSLMAYVLSSYWGYARVATRRMAGRVLRGQR